MTKYYTTCQAPTNLLLHICSLRRNKAKAVFCYLPFSIIQEKFQSIFCSSDAPVGSCPFYITKNHI